MGNPKYATSKNKNLDAYFGFCDWALDRSKLCPLKVPETHAKALIQLILKMLKEEYVSSEDLFYISMKQKGGGLDRIKKILNIKTRTIQDET